MRQKINQNWSSDGKEEENIPSVYYMTDGRRGYHPSPHIDLLICVLEAAARLPNGLSLLKEGRMHSSPIVQWTAHRLQNRAMK